MSHHHWHGGAGDALRLESDQVSLIFDLPGVRFQPSAIPVFYLDHHRASRRDHNHVDFVRLSATSDAMREIRQNKGPAFDWQRPKVLTYCSKGRLFTGVCECPTGQMINSHAPSTSTLPMRRSPPLAPSHREHPLRPIATGIRGLENTARFIS